MAAKTKAAAKRRKKGFTIPIAVLGGFIPLLGGSYDAYRAHGAAGFRIDFVRRLTGYDTHLNQWHHESMWGGTFPIAIGLLIHKVASRLGVNRALASAGVPIVRL